MGMFDLTGRVALVTGAGRGLGRAIAGALAGQGAMVLLNGREAGPLEEAAAAIRAAGGRAVPAAADMTDPAAREALVAGIRDRHGRLDILVNNAGVGSWERVVDADPADWRREVEVNLIAPMFATSAAVPHLLARGGGHIVNVSSLAARGPGPSWAGYAASKAGLNVFSDSVQADLRGQGIKVTLIETGEVATEMQSDADIASMAMLFADDVADAIVFALTRPSHVCIADIQMFAPRIDGPSASAG